MNRKKMIIIIVFVISFFSNLNYYSASRFDCETSDREFLEEVADLIEVVFEEKNGKFSATINNVYLKFNLLDNNTGLEYSGYDSDSFVITNLKSNDELNLSVYSNVAACYQHEISNIVEAVPTSNVFYDNYICNNINGYKVCDKWGTYNYSEAELRTYINSYVSSYYRKYPINSNEVDTLVDFFMNYYVYFSISIIFISVSLILFVFIKDRKNKMF